LIWNFLEISAAMSQTSSSRPPSEKPDIDDLAARQDEKQIEDGEKGAGSPDEGPQEHSKGFALAMVIVALVLSVFLVALDMVNFFFFFFEIKLV
jgi:hypothetical protein